VVHSQLPAGVDGILKSVTDAPTIIAGDLNLSVHLKDGLMAAAQLDRLAKKQFADLSCEPSCAVGVGRCTKRHTITRSTKAVECRIDYILANPAAAGRMRSTRTIDDTNVRKFSDHNPLITDIAQMF